MAKMKMLTTLFLFASVAETKFRTTTITTLLPTVATKFNQATFLLRKLPDHLKLGKTLSLSREKNIIGDNLFTNYKYLGCYLARFLTPGERQVILAFHYSYYLQHLIATVDAGQILKDGITIWERKCGDDTLTISLAPSDPTDMEGELALRFSCNSFMLYSAAFSIIPGSILNLSPEPVLFIGSIQGRAGCADKIRHAAKLNREISPPSMLLLATQSLCMALGISSIAGVAASQQACIDIDINFEQYLTAYDEFWTASGGTMMEGKYFLLALIPPEKPILEIPKYNRTRVKAKRRRKHEIREEIRHTLAYYYTP